uniref:Uncharacterized protein n=1 Tax=Arundo donax TaxID=35708 RepID=A0A0A9F4C9_ARUDO
MAGALVGILVHYCEYRNLEISPILFSHSQRLNFVLKIGYNLHGILFGARY